jgi:hypothetical protein
MANRNFNRFQALEKEIKTLYAEISIGATGAPTLTKGAGIASISRTSEGLYVLTLSDVYYRLMSFFVICQAATAAVPLHFQMTAHSESSKTITFQAYTDDGDQTGTAQDPASGDILFIKIDVKNSSVEY